MRRIGLVVAFVALATTARAGVDWQSNYDDAMAKAKKEKKLVMVDVYTDWCGWCKKLDKDVYSKPEIQAKLQKNFIAVKINPEKNQKNREVAERFGVRGYPNIVFVDATGKKLYQQPGYSPADEFGKTLDEVVKKAVK